MKYQRTVLVIPQGKSLKDELNNFGDWELKQAFRIDGEDVNWLVIFEKEAE